MTTVHEWLMSLKAGDVIDLRRHNITRHEFEYYCTEQHGYPNRYLHLLKLKPVQTGSSPDKVKLVCRHCLR